MKGLDASLAFTALFFLLTVASGVWLTRFGKPLNVVIFTIHKLIALATVILTGVTFFNLLKTVNTKTTLTIGAIVVTGLLFLVLFITGALLSLKKPLTEPFLTIHKVVPLLALISTAVTIYLLISSTSR